MPKQSRLGDDALIYQPRKKQTEKEKLREMSFQDKFSYLWEYYKLQALGIAAIIAIIIYIIYSILNPPIVTEFNAAIINNTVDNTVLDNCRTDFAKHLQLNSKRQRVEFNTSYNFGIDDPYSMNIRQALIAHIASHEVDVIIAPESNFKEYAYNGYFNKLSDQLPTNIYSSLTDKFYMSNTEGTKKKDVYGIYLTDTKLFKDYTNSKDPYILGVVANSKHEDNTVEFIRCLFKDK